MLMAIGPKSLAPGGVLRLSFAMVYSRVENKTNGVNTSYKKMKDDVTQIHAWIAEDDFPSCDGFANAVEKVDELNFKVYPNPGNSQVNIVFPEGVESVNYRVIDVQGRVLMQGNMIKDQAQLQTEALINGYYLIELQGDFGRVVQAWIKN